MLLRTGSLQQVVFFTGQRALAVDPRDGRLLWSYNRASNSTANIATPIVRGNRVFFSSDYGTGAALLDVRRRAISRRRRRSTSPARCATTTRRLSSSAITSTGFRAAS